MGAWDSGVFDNDMALDWVDGLAVGGAAHVRGALHRAASCAPGDYLDADDGQMALAAAETVARWLGAPGLAPLTTVDDWVARQAGPPDRALVQQAAAAVDRVLAPSSEIASLWGASSPWGAEVQALRARLGP